MTNAYAALRAHRTPIPTPPAVRLACSLLGGIAVAVLSTDLSRGAQVAIAAACILLGLLFPLVHPYRHRVREYRRDRGACFSPQVWQFLPLFFLWLALMLAPLLAPAPTWASALLLIGAAGWLYLTFPHIDGTRALAYLPSQA